MYCNSVMKNGMEGIVRWSDNITRIFFSEPTAFQFPHCPIVTVLEQKHNNIGFLNFIIYYFITLGKFTHTHIDRV